MPIIQMLEESETIYSSLFFFQKKSDFSSFNIQFFLFFFQASFYPLISEFSSVPRRPIISTTQR